MTPAKTLIVALLLTGCAGAQEPTPAEVDTEVRTEVPTQVPTAPVVWPIGLVEIDGPIESPKSVGGYMAVQGWSSWGYGQTGAQNDEPTSAKLWGKTATVLAVRGEGEAAWTVSGGYARLGCFTLRNDGRYHAALRVRHRGSFNGGKHDISNVTLVGFPGAGLELGDRDEPNRPGNDNITARHLHVSRCGALAEFVSRQAMDFHCDVAHVRGCGAVLRLTAGGDGVVEQLNVDVGTPWVVVPEDADAKAIGPNNGKVVIVDAKVDDTAGTIELVREETGVWLDVTLVRPHFPSRAIKPEPEKPTDPKPIRARTRLVGRDSRLRIEGALNFPRYFDLDITGGASCLIIDTPLKSLPPDWGDMSDGRVELVRCPYGGGVISGVW